MAAGCVSEAVQRARGTQLDRVVRAKATLTGKSRASSVGGRCHKAAEPRSGEHGDARPDQAVEDGPEVASLGYRRIRGPVRIGYAAISDPIRTPSPSDVLYRTDPWVRVGSPFSIEMHSG